MPRPGVTVSLLDTPTISSFPTDSGTAFIVGLSDRGPADQAVLVTSLSDFVGKMGDRVSYSPLYDSVEVFFREGGGQAYIGRVVGPGATKGSLNLLDGGAAISLVATAVGAGAWSANYKVQVAAGVGAGTFVVRVLDGTTNVVLEDSGDLATQDAAVTWSLLSKYIRLSLGVSINNPAVMAATALSAGTDDRASITDAQWLAALNLFTSGLGPGQVLAPGRTTTAGQNQLIAHAEANNRYALLDFANSPTEATLEGYAVAVKSRMAMHAGAPWPVIPGVSGTSTERTVPSSAFTAGLIARNDNAYGANRASAGNAGILLSPTRLSQPEWTDAQRQTMNGYGVNVFRSMFGTIRMYGWRSLAGSGDINWVGANDGRFNMALSAELDDDAENFVFAEIDGQNGDTINGYHGALYGTMLAHFQNGDLFGDTPDDAFRVDTGPDVNTLDTIANHELHAVVSYKNSPFAEWVQIQVVKRLVTQSL